MQQLSEKSTDCADTDIIEVRPKTARRKYGNLKVLFENDRFLITVGPDYPCSMFAILGFAALDYFIVNLTMTNSDSEILQFLTIIGAIIQIFVYILIITSNPGISTQADFDTQNQEQIKRYCKICEIPMLPKARHCSDCGVCIKGYDHHCPWTSKCIGQNNLVKFYIFCFYTFFYIIYSIVLASILAS